MTRDTWRQAWRIARRELRGGLTGFRIFLACLTLGVGVIAAIGSIRSSVEQGLAQQGATLLGGDAEVTFTYRHASAEERAWMESQVIALSEILDFRSMAVVGEDRVLTQVKAVDGAYPLVGDLLLSPDIPLEEALKPVDGLPGAVIERSLAERLSIEPGQSFTLGTQTFRLNAYISVEPDAASGGLSLAPRTLVASAALADSGLLAPGTLYSSKYRMILRDGLSLPDVQAAAEEKFAHAGLSWRDSRNAAPGVRRFVDRLGAFLVLVGISGLAVGGVGISAAVRAYLSTKTATIAMLRTLGADRQTIFLTYFLQISVLTGIGIVLGLIVGGLVPRVIGPVIAAKLPFSTEFAIYPDALIEAALYGILTAFLFTLWPLARTERIRAAALIRGNHQVSRTLPPLPYILTTALALAGLIGMAALFSGSFQLTLWVAAGLMAALIVLQGAALVVVWTARRLNATARGHPALRWALSALANTKETASSGILALGLGLTVVAAIGQIDGNMRRAIENNLPDVAPTFFFVDIQRAQMPDFLARVTEDPGVTKVESAPMLRGVITQINGRPATEVAGDHWVLRGDRGVTYANEKPENTTVVEGAWWEADYQGPPQISIADEEAREMGLKIGDSLTVNILGRDITAEITSFREVDFSTAGMGFILAMNEAALKGAPHSYIATVYAEQKSEADILRDLGRQMPNITAIPVREAIGRVGDILQQLAAATAYGAAATLLTGFLVLLGTAAAEEPARRYEAAILKSLGATRRMLFVSFALRAGLVGVSAGLVALFAGVGAAWAINTYVFEAEFTVIWANALLVIGGGVAVTLLAGFSFSAAPLRARPAQQLRARD